MRNRPKTIQIYLPFGDPRNIRFAGMTNGIMRLVEIPRLRLENFFQMDEAQHMGVYFLVGASEESDKPAVYIGQTSDLVARLKSHNRDKEFWQRAFVAVSLTQNLTAAHTLYLEKLLIQRVAQVGRNALHYGNSGSQSIQTPDWICADCEDIFENIDTLLTTLNQPMLEPLMPMNSNRLPEKTMVQVKEDVESASEPVRFYCKGLNADAYGYYTDEGFVLQAGSLLRKQAVASLGDAAVRIRTEWLQQGLLLEESPQQLKLTEEMLLNQPSTASQVVLARPSNGWVEWKTATGQTLDECYRR